jgi:hypothetical protein
MPSLLNHPFTTFNCLPASLERPRIRRQVRHLDKFVVIREIISVHKQVEEMRSHLSRQVLR